MTGAKGSKQPRFSSNPASSHAIAADVTATALSDSDAPVLAWRGVFIARFVLTSMRTLRRQGTGGPKLLIGSSSGATHDAGASAILVKESSSRLHWARRWCSLLPIIRPRIQFVWRAGGRHDGHDFPRPAPWSGPSNIYGRSWYAKDFDHRQRNAIDQCGPLTT